MSNNTKLFYTLRELAIICGISENTMRTYIKPLKEKIKKTGRYYSINQVKLIFEHLNIDWQPQ